MKNSITDFKRRLKVGSFVIFYRFDIGKGYGGLIHKVTKNHFIIACEVTESYYKEYSPIMGKDAFIAKKTKGVSTYFALCKFAWQPQGTYEVRGSEIIFLNYVKEYVSGVPILTPIDYLPEGKPWLKVRVV